jgi:sulfate permease, SulP family
VEMFSNLRSQLASQGITLHLVGLKLPVETMLREAGELPEGELLHLYRTEAEALQANWDPVAEPETEVETEEEKS